MAGPADWRAVPGNPVRLSGVTQETSRRTTPETDLTHNAPRTSGDVAQAPGVQIGLLLLLLLLALLGLWIVWSLFAST